MVQSGKLSRFALPDRVATREALPKTSVGKIDKKLLRKQYAAKGVSE
jgi:fatty-acyl-CoA synthase